MAKKLREPIFNEPVNICEDLLTTISICKELDDDFKNYSVKKQELFEIDCHKLCFENIMFTNCRFENINFEYSFFDNIIFDNCSLLNCNFADSKFSVVAFKNSQCKGCNFSNSGINNTSFVNTNLKYSNFTSCKIDNFLADNCDMSYTFLGECKLSNFVVKSTSLLCAELFRTSLNGVDLTSCNIEGIVLSENNTELKGAKVSMMQAIELAKLLGVIVE